MANSHLLITHPVDASLIESLLLKKCKSSSHTAILTLWYLEAHFLDTQRTCPSTPLYYIAKRLVHRFHHQIFKSVSVNNRLSPVHSTGVEKTGPLIKDHLAPTIIGVGAIFSAFGCPSIAKQVKDMVLNQGMRSRIPSASDLVKYGSSVSLLDEEGQSLSPGPPVPPKDQPGTKQDSHTHHLSNDYFKETPSLGTLKMLSKINVSSASLEELSTGLAFTLRKKPISRGQSFDDRGLLSSLSATKPKPSFGSAGSHYFYSETQFLLTLVDIADRLRSVPKQARQSTLIAELTLFNHNLPADVCLPLWCPASATHPHHHRVVRISPSDSTVLNSAERVPYLILVEVIESETTPTTISAKVSESTKSGKEIVPKMDSFHDSLHQEETLSSCGSGDLSNGSAELLENFSRINLFLAQGSQGSLRNSLSSGKDVPVKEPLKIITKVQPEETEIHEDKNELKIADMRANPLYTSIKPEDIDKRMRTAAVMLAQLYQQQNPDRPQPKSQTAPSQAHFGEIRARLIQEMLDLEAVRVSSLESRVGDLSIRSPTLIQDTVSGSPGLSNVADHDKEDPSAAVFREPWSHKMERIRSSSPYGHHPNWKLVSVIVKAGVDLRQEQLALQLIYEMSRIWSEENVPVWIHK